MYSEFNLWPVGQGLFYTGNINDGQFKFIYDCGGNETLINDSVKHYIYKEGPPDMLVISHFHEDHINGLPYLLNNIEKKIDKIFIPYYKNIDSYLLLLSYVLGSDANLSGKVNQIIMVDAGNPENKDDDPLDDVTSYIPQNIKLNKINKSNFVFDKIWEFKFYNARLKNSSTSVKSDVDNLIKEYKCSTLNDLLKNTQDWDSLKSKFQAIYDKYCSPSKRNQSSLCLYHSPINIHKYNCLFYQYNCTCYPCYCTCHNYYLQNHCGTILTGDISLRGKNNYSKFLTYYEKEEKNTTFFLLPHHGSKYNWNSDILCNFHKPKIFLNSAGLGCRYNHPSEKVVSEIKNNNDTLLCSNQLTLVKYIIKKQ